MMKAQLRHTESTLMLVHGIPEQVWKENFPMFCISCGSFPWLVFADGCRQGAVQRNAVATSAGSVTTCVSASSVSGSTLSTKAIVFL